MKGLGLGLGVCHVGPSRASLRSIMKPSRLTEGLMISASALHAANGERERERVCE